MRAAQGRSRLLRDSAFVGAATVVSRLLGFARDVLIARLLGAGPVADAYLAALRLPNLVRRVLGEGGLNAPFVPLYLAVKTEDGEEAARRFAGQALAQLALLLGLAVALGLVFAPWLVLGLAGGFREEPDTLALAARYTRLMLPFLALTTLAALIGALLNAERRFTLAALGPALANLLLIGLLVPMLLYGAAATDAAFWLSLGVSATGLVHLALVLSDLPRIGWPRLSLRWSPELTRLVRTGGATLLAASAGQAVLLVSTQIASGESGAVAALYYADRVFQLPLGFVGVAMGTVVLSEMAHAAGRAGGDAIDRALVSGLALAVPAAVALFFLAEPIVSVLFEHGRFDMQDRIRTAGALAGFAPGLPFAVAAKVFGQAYFVRRRPKPPLVAGGLALAGAIAVGLVAGGTDAAAIAAWAASAAFAIQAAALAAASWREGLWRPRPALLRPLAGIACAALAMLAGLLALMPALLPCLQPEAAGPARFAALAALCAAGIALYGLAAWAFGVAAYLRRSRA